VVGKNNIVIYLTLYCRADCMC